MDTRVSMQTIYQTALADNQRITDQLASLQTQASTGQRFSKISDDPAASLSILANNDQDQILSSHLANIQTATTALNASVSAMQKVSDVFSQAKALAIQASNSANDTSSFSAMAQQVNAMINNLLSIANTQNNGVYIFGGTAGRTQPYAVTSQDSAGNPQTIAYQGAKDAARSIVDANQQVDVYYSGNEVFQDQNRQAAIFTGGTGAAPGTGTDSASAEGTLVINHTSTTFAPGSGIQAGASSAQGDTILGPAGAHTLHIVDTSGNGTAGTVSLDGGPAVAFTGADTDLRVTNSAGDVVYLNSTTITPGFSGNIAVTSNGTLSTDGGVSSTPLTFAANQSVTDSKTGGVTFVDTTKVARTGNETISYPGTYDAFQALVALRDDLQNTNHLATADQIKALSSRIAALDSVNARVLQATGRQSAALQSLSALQSHLGDLQLSVKQTINDLGGADVTDVVVKLQSYEQMLQLSLMTFSRITSTSLLNYLH